MCMYINIYTHTYLVIPTIRDRRLQPSSVYIYAFILSDTNYKGL